MLGIERYPEIAYDTNDHAESRRRFGLAIRSLRKSQEVSLKGLSKKIGINFSYLSRVENGLVPASGKLVEVLADGLETSRFDLAIQSGLLTVDWNRITEPQLVELKQIVDSGAFILRNE